MFKGFTSKMKGETVLINIVHRIGHKLNTHQNFFLYIDVPLLLGIQLI